MIEYKAITAKTMRAIVMYQIWNFLYSGVLPNKQIIIKRSEPHSMMDDGFIKKNLTDRAARRVIHV